VRGEGKGWDRAGEGGEGRRGMGWDRAGEGGEGRKGEGWDRAGGGTSTHLLEDDGVVSAL
jgi:hypothetical protein